MTSRVQYLRASVGQSAMSEKLKNSLINKKNCIYSTQTLKNCKTSITSEKNCSLKNSFNNFFFMTPSRHIHQFSSKYKTKNLGSLLKNQSNCTENTFLKICVCDSLTAITDNNLFNCTEKDG